MESMFPTSFKGFCVFVPRLGGLRKGKGNWWNMCHQTAEERCYSSKGNAA